MTFLIVRFSVAYENSDKPYRALSTAYQQAFRARSRACTGDTLGAQNLATRGKAQKKAVFGKTTTHGIAHRVNHEM
jgi:hypothetical protein